MEGDPPAQRISQESSSSSRARPGISDLQVAVVYLAFGVAHAIVMTAYCNYRAAAGNPSDLPCVSWLWTPMEILGWPMMAAADAVNGYAVLVPSFLVRSVGIAFIAGFVATLVWIHRNPRTSSP